MSAIPGGNTSAVGTKLTLNHPDASANSQIWRYDSSTQTTLKYNTHPFLLPFSLSCLVMQVRWRDRGPTVRGTKRDSAGCGRGGHQRCPRNHMVPSASCQCYQSKVCARTHARMHEHTHEIMHARTTHA